MKAGRSSIRERWLLLLFFFLAFVTSLPVKSQIDGTGEMYTVLLIDGSLSMKDSDPAEYRKMASQVIFSILSPADNISIVQFSSKAEVLLPWTKASDRKSLFEGIGKISSIGTTDYLLGFQKALELLADLPENARKVILLFSDGEISPDPYNNIYSPLDKEYKILIAGKSQQERSAIYEDFRHKLTPIAKNKIDESILPVLQEKKIEIFSVAFSKESDKTYMKYLSDKTNLKKIEQRFFYVESPTDITRTFLALLPYWQNKVVLLSEAGTVSGTISGSVYIDEYLKDLSAIAISDAELDFKVSPSGKTPLPKIEGTHSSLSIVPFGKSVQNGNLIYTLSGTNGNYQLLIVGESAIRIEVENLKPSYLYGESLDVRALLRIGDNDALNILSNKPNILAEVLKEEQIVSEKLLKPSDKIFSLKYDPLEAGLYKLRFTLKALDNKGMEMLPRPSREYQFNVLPRLYVEPDHISFGTVKRGSKAPFKITVHNGLDETVSLKAASTIISCSKEIKSELTPFVEGNIEVAARTVAENTLELVVPKGKLWGNFEGNIQLNSDSGGSFKITFTIHVPSWIEKAALFTVPFLILLLIGFIVLLVIWSNLKTPEGILYTVKYPTGVILDDIKLSRVKRGFFSKYINWKKNEVTIGNFKSDFYLEDLPEGSKIRIKFIFFRFGRDYIKNESVKGNDADMNYDDLDLIVSDSEIGVDLSLSPGRSYSLSNGLEIKIAGYEFRYQIT